MFEYHQLNDSELAELLIKKDERSFAEIYKRYWTIMYMHALRMLRNEEDTRDVVQEVFTNLWVKHSTLKSTENLAGYLYASIKNKVLDSIAQKRTQLNHLDSLSKYITSTDNKLLEEITDREMMEALDQEIEQLPAKMKIIFEMRVKQHKTYKEIAEELNISDKTVKKQVSNAIKIVKPRLNGFIGWPILLYFLSSV
ncbi:MAG: RNA polymerase sigma-70 factor [Bacteroidota bacterium]